MTIVATYNRSISGHYGSFWVLVGRKTEIKRLEKAYRAKHAEFIVLYGRRRVGKTFLIKQFFSHKKCKFLQATGLKKGSMLKQLEKFSESFSETFLNGVAIKTPISWHEAFQLLNKTIEDLKTKDKIIIFLDELPWMATRKSGLLQEIDYYWNRYWSNDPKVILVVCGSSASWLIKNIIYDTGGLHNRCTAEIRLEPFTLGETMEFLLSRNVRLNREQILDVYMTLGGIPYYLNYIEPNISAADNIQNVLFARNAPLKDEFRKLFDSLFKDAAIYIELIRLIAGRKEGISRSELVEKMKFSKTGGRLSTRLKQLEQTSFIARYISWNKERGEYFKVIDEFCLFYLNWIDSLANKLFSSDHWSQQIRKPHYQVWSGYAFESVCFKHIEQIIHTLHIKTAEAISSWRSYAKKNSKGAQIDLLIDRADNAITLCEIKYTAEPFTITKQYAERLKNKMTVFENATKTPKQLFMALISANGVTVNQYSNELLSGIVKLEDLFNET